MAEWVGGHNGTNTHHYAGDEHPRVESSRWLLCASVRHDSCTHYSTCTRDDCTLMCVQQGVQRFASACTRMRLSGELRSSCSSTHTSFGCTHVAHALVTPSGLWCRRMSLMRFLKRLSSVYLTRRVCLIAVFLTPTRARQCTHALRRFDAEAVQTCSLDSCKS